MGKSKRSKKSDLNVQPDDHQQLSEEDHSNLFGDAGTEHSQFPVAAATYDPHTERLISKQATSALLYLLFYSILMFTLPFAAFFGAQHVLRDHTDLSEQAITSLSVISSVVTIYIIIALYAMHAYHEKDVVLPDEKSAFADEADAPNKEKPKKAKQKNL